MKFSELQRLQRREGITVLSADERIEQLEARLRTITKERDALRVKIERMERQEPVAKVRVHRTGGNAGLAWSVAPLNDFDSLPLMRDGDRLYALPGAQPAPSAPNGWLRAIDEALVVAHIGVANPSDTYEQARVKLDSLIGFHADVATDPTVNGGWKLVPIEPTQEMRDAWTSHVYSSFRVAYQAMIAAAMGAKP